MRTVFFIDHLRPDGTQTFLQLLTGELGARGHRQAVVCLNDSYDPTLVGALRAAGVEVRVIGRRALLSGVGLLATYLWLRARRFDAAVTMLLYADVLGRPLARAGGIETIVTALRARNVNYTAWQRALVRATMRWTDVVVINSESIRAFARRAEGATDKPMIAIPNGVVISHTPDTRRIDVDELHAELGIGSSRRLIGSVGRLTHQKGFDLLIEALAQLGRDDVDALLIGDGDDRRQLAAQADRLGLSHRVRFTGRRTDVPQLLRALDVYVHPARFEGMPNAVLEAMAAGRPIVATDVDGSAELLDESCGWLVAPENPHALAGAIRVALEQPDEAARRGAAARRRVAERYSVTAMADAWERVLAGTEQEISHAQTS